METSIIQLILFFIVALLGHVAHILTKLARLEKAKEKFSIKTWIQKNLLSTILGVVTTLLSIFILGGMEQLNYATAALVGYVGDSFIKNAAARFNQKTKTDAG